MVFLDIEDFDETRRDPRRITIIATIIFVAFVAVFLLFFARPANRRITARQNVDVSLSLKLSANDVRGFLGNSESRDLVNVTVIESQKKVNRAKLGHRIHSGTDFMLEIDDITYNLFMLDYKRREVYNFFQLAHLWGIETSATQIAELKINGVPIGYFVMEPEVYEHIRDAKKNYYISLGANTYRLRKILYFVKNLDTELLRRYFDLDKLASYLVYFSLFSFQEVLEFNKLVFFYDSRKQSYSPFLTIKSVLSTLEDHGKEFKNHDEYNFLSYRGLDHKNTRNLLDKAGNHEFRELIEFVLQRASQKL